MLLSFGDFASFLVEYGAERVDHFDEMTSGRDLGITSAHDRVDLVEPRVDLGVQELRFDREHHWWKLDTILI